MVVATRLLLLLALAGTTLAQQRSLSTSTRRRNRLPAGKSEVLDFSCPEDFGYYQHPTDCTQYYVCVFGGALQESCSGGLVYSHDLQTCDWPRNVVCNVDLAAPVSTVRITDPRTAEPPRQRGPEQSLTPSVSSNGFAESFRSPAGRSKDQLSGPSSAAVNRQGRIIQGKSDIQQQQQPIRGRFQVQESTNRAFSVSPTTSRTFSFPPAVPGIPSSSSSLSSPRSSSSPSSTSRVEPRPISSPLSRGSQQSQSVTPAPVELEPNFYSDLLNLTDDEYFYLYDDLLLEDYFDASATTTTQRSVTRTPIRDRERFTPIRETEGTTASRSPSSFSSPSFPQTRGNSITTVDDRTSSFPQTQTFPETRGSSSSRASSNLSRGNPSSSSQTTTFSQTRSNSISSDPGRDSTPNRGPPRRSQSRAQSSSTSSSSSRTNTKSPSQSQGRVSTDSSRPSRLTVKPVSEHLKNSNHLITNVWKYPPRRPAPLYPTPPVNTKANKCDRKACRLPDCSCGGKEVPGGIPPEQAPQLVLLTFDDAVNDLNKNLYQDMFEKGRVNANGCPIAATFYISHEWTDYSQVQNLYSDGHEIASHSITHSFGEQFSKNKWAKEIAGQREIMSAYGGVNMEDIRGMRAPFLAVGGNKMFEMLYEQNFTYDSSMPVYENRPPSYPYTLDYKLFHDCMIPPCPTNSFPGLWEVPMVMWQDLNGGRCSMGDACTTPPDAEGVYKMLIKNFERHYTTNRAPMGLFYHAAWFTTAHHKEGFIAFLDTISGMPDVWLVTNWQALQWMRDPVPISQANNFKPFQCNYPERPARCKSHKVCNVWHKGGVRYMRTCQRCPEAYPWVGATGVDSPLNSL